MEEWQSFLADWRRQVEDLRRRLPERPGADSDPQVLLATQASWYSGGIPYRISAVQTLTPSWKLLYGVKATMLDDEIEDSPIGQDDAYTVVNFGAAYSF